MCCVSSLQQRKCAVGFGVWLPGLTGGMRIARCHCAPPLPLLLLFLPVFIWFCFSFCIPLATFSEVLLSLPNALAAVPVSLIAFVASCVRLSVSGCAAQTSAMRLTVLH